MKNVLTLTMNPALDMSMSTREVSPWRKLRGDSVRYDPGGGGVNVSRVIGQLGGESTALLAAGGQTGEMIRGLLVSAGIRCVRLPAEGVSRPSIHVFAESSSELFRFVPAGPMQNADNAEQVLGILRQELKTGRYGYVVASGSLPPGIPDDFYARVAKLIRGSGTRLFVDAAGRALREAFETGPFLIKPNNREATELLGVSGEERLTPAEISQQLFERKRAEVILMTLGKGGALLTTAGGQVMFHAPAVKIRSTVGAGDSFLGAFTYGLTCEWSLTRACRYAVCAGTAAVMSEGTASVNRADIEKLLDKVTETRIH